MRFVHRLVGVALVLMSLLLIGCEADKQGKIQLFATEYKGTIAKDYITTDDKWVLEVTHYPPKKILLDRDPIILCHGLSYNNRFWDLGERVSLARYLAHRGWDVWSVSLRGAGLSSQPFGKVMEKVAQGRFDLELFTTIQKRSGSTSVAAFGDYSVDDHIQYDLPAVIDYVLAQTKRKQLHWIGHSMGGMVMFGYLATHPKASARIHSFVALAVPIVVFHPVNKGYQIMVEMPEAVKLGQGFSGIITGLADKILPKKLVSGGTNALFMNTGNVDEKTFKALTFLAQETIGNGQLAQLIKMVQNERFVSKDGKTDYVAALPNITTPILFMVGAVDNMATVGAVKYTYRAVGSNDKAFHLLSRINGAKAEYGHDDLVIGKHSRRDVYPVIQKWLLRHRTGPMQHKSFPMQPTPEGTLPPSLKGRSAGKLSPDTDKAPVSR